MSWTCFIGVLIFTRGVVSAGLEGMPRRIFRAGAAYHSPAWDLGGALTGIGGTAMFVGLFLFFVVMLMTVISGKKGEAPTDIPWSETLTVPSGKGFEPTWDRIGLWVGVAAVLVLLAGVPFFFGYLPPHFVSPGYQFF